MSTGPTEERYLDEHGRHYKYVSIEQRAQLRQSYVAKVPRWRHPLIGYSVVAPLFGLGLLGIMNMQQVFMHFLFPGAVFALALLVVALFWGAGPAIVMLILITLALEYFFITPTGWLMPITWQAVGEILPLIISGLVIILITDQRERARLRALAAEAELQVYADELETLNQKLGDANRAKDQFLSIASHELKTPVTSIRGQAQLLLRRLAKQKKAVPDVEGLAATLRRINDQTGRLTTLMDELLDVSSMRAGKAILNKSKVDLGAICGDVVEDQRFLTDRQLVLNVPSTQLEIWVDADRLAQVLINLLSNAMKYSPEGSPVEIVVSRESEHALIQVSDYGRGIAKDQLPHIFETFYRTPDVQESSTQGLGLGLSITKDIVERHNGHVWCESELDKGSTFFVQLPLSEHEAGN